jgi:alkane 1-monooxygenase
MIPPAYLFLTSFSLVPVVVGLALLGGWWMLLIPAYAWIFLSLCDAAAGIDTSNPDPNSDADLFRHKMLTWVWPPMQFALVFGGIAYASRAMGTWEAVGLMAGIGIVSGAIGINFAHELMHQKNRWERLAADFLMTMVAYGHFRSEHLLVHHRYIGTPRDPVTARYNEGFPRFFVRVLWQCLKSSWLAEATLLARRDLPWYARRNPFWRYLGFSLGFALLAYAIAGWWGVALWALQAYVAVLHLELVNYVEHYGLVRKHLGDGKYEPVRPHHSWNAGHKVTNWFLINLQRHSDHHYKPDRRFPLLQTYDEAEAPQLPYGYPLMVALANVPPLYRRVMNPRVKAWRKRYYPEITDWTPYKDGTNPMPR